MPDEDAAPELVTADGPDPRDWPGVRGDAGDPSIWDLVEDIETLERAAKALVGSNDDHAGAAYPPARRFLATALHQRKGLLAVRLLATYGIELDEDAEQEGPFSHAGRPRAFGAEPPPAAGNV